MVGRRPHLKPPLWPLARRALPTPPPAAHPPSSAIASCPGHAKICRMEDGGLARVVVGEMRRAGVGAEGESASCAAGGARPQRRSAGGVGGVGGCVGEKRKKINTTLTCGAHNLGAHALEFLLELRSAFVDLRRGAWLINWM